MQLIFTEMTFGKKQHISFAEYLPVAASELNF